MDLSKFTSACRNARRKKRVGRGIGSGQGKTCGRGTRASMPAPAPRCLPGLFEGGQTPLFRRIAQARLQPRTWDKTYHVVNVGDIDAALHDGDAVNAESLKEKGLAKGPADGIRILGDGEVTKKLTVRADHFSKSAEEKIKAKGGKAM